MRHLLILLISILLLTSPLFGQSERPETIIIPVSSLGNVSEVRKQILQNTLTDELKKHFRIVPQEKYEQVLEQVFEELEYEECSEDTCIMRVQEMLQVENVFNLQVLGEGKDSQLNLKWITLDEKKNEEDYCEGCGTGELRKMIEGLVEKLVGVKVFEKPVVVVRTPKVLPKKVQEPIIKETKVDRTDGLFVGVGSDGNILISPDGTSWTKITSLTSTFLSGITYGKGLFVTVGSKRTSGTSKGTILTSPDGKSWTKRTSGISNTLYGVTYGNGLFVTVGSKGTILTSPDGKSWTKRTSGGIFNTPYTYKDLKRVTYGRGLFVTVGNSGTILTSSDGKSWNEETSPTSKKLIGLTYGNGLFVTVGRGTILSSLDGNSWTQRTSPTSKYLMGVTYGNGLFVGVGNVGTILTSPDGKWWTKRTSGTSKWIRGVTYGNGLFVTVGDSGTILTSPDGNSWTQMEYQRTSGKSNNLYGVTFQLKKVEPVVIVEKKEKGVLYERNVNGKWGWYQSGDEKKDSKYVGEIENGVPNGQGTMNYSNGRKYVGEWRDERPNGQGTMTYPNGDKYVGEWKDGKFNGQGTLTSSDGRKFVGEFKDSKPWNITGYDKNGNIKRKWVNGK